MTQCFFSNDTPYGPLDLECTAYNRIVHLTPAQFDAMQLPEGGKVKTTSLLTQQEFQAMVDNGNLSFPSQVPHILQAFENGFNIKLPRKVKWVL